VLIATFLWPVTQETGFASRSEEQGNHIPIAVRLAPDRAAYETPSGNMNGRKQISKQ